MSVDYDAMSHVIRSDYRMAVFEDLADGPATPSQIAERVEYTVPHVSRSLQELRDQGVVDLMVSEDTKKGRLYALTDEGKDIAKEIEDGNGGVR